MKMGCFGCLTIVVILLVLIVGFLGVLFLSVNIGEAPDFRPVAFSRGEGQVAQQKLFEIALRQSGRSSRRDPIVLTEREVNAFLSRHLSASAKIPLDPIAVRFGRHTLQVQGQTSLRNLLQGPPFAQVVPYLPSRTVDRPVWVTVRGRFLVEPSTGSTKPAHGRFELSEFAMGKQPVGGWILLALLGPTHSVFRWEIPTVVRDVTIEDERVLIHTR